MHKVGAFTRKSKLCYFGGLTTPCHRSAKVCFVWWEWAYRNKYLLWVYSSLALSVIFATKQSILLILLSFVSFENKGRKNVHEFPVLQLSKDQAGGWYNGMTYSMHKTPWQLGREASLLNCSFQSLHHRYHKHARLWHPPLSEHNINGNMITNNNDKCNSPKGIMFKFSLWT